MSDEIVVHETEFHAEVDRRAKALLTRLAEKYERIIQNLFRISHSGRIYTKGSVEHRASAPGEPPAIDTGALSKAVTHGQPTKEGDNLSIDIGVTIESGRAQIAEFLEFGTSKIEPRPAWRPSLETLRQEAAEEAGQ